MQHPRIVVIGLGYVGLPLAVALADHFEVTGFDIDPERLAELERGHDRTREVDAERLTAGRLRFTCDPAEARGRDLYIVTVPTPVDGDNRPDSARCSARREPSPACSTRRACRRSSLKAPSTPE